MGNLAPAKILHTKTHYFIFWIYYKQGKPYLSLCGISSAMDQNIKWEITTEQRSHLHSYFWGEEYNLGLVAIRSTEQDEVSDSVHKQRGILYFCSFGRPEFSSFSAYW